MWENLKNTVNNVIKPNDNREITGEKHNNTLSAVINSLGKYSQFAGLAFKNTNPGVPDGPVFYFAAFKGVYINFNRIEVKENEVAILNYNNNKWGKIVIGYSPIAPATAEDIRLTAFIDAVNDNNALKTNFEFKQDSIADVQLPFLHAAVSHIDADGQLIKGKPTSEVLIPVPLAEPSIDVDTPGKHGFMSYQDKDLLDSIPNYTISGKKISENPILTHDDIQGVAYLGEDGKIPSSLLPSYVDDVIEYDSIDNFPLIGEGGKIYLDKKTNLAYRWSGTTYVSISSSIALGETSSTAYAGDKGKKNAEDIADLKTNKADKTSVYTKEEVDYLLEHFKLPDHIKAITFSVDGILLSKNENGDLVIGGNVVVEGGISMYGPGQFGDSIMDYIIVDNESIKIIDGKLTVDPNFVGGGTVKGIKVNGYTYDEVDTNGYITIPDYPTELAWNSITGKPSTFTPSAHTHKIEDITDIADASVSHATTADRLKKEIMIWGQPFDGSTDVEGAISNVDVINMANADTVISLYIKDNVLFIDGDLAVTGGITMYASNGVTSGLLDQVYAILDSSKFEIENGVITIKGDIGDGKVKGATLGGVAVTLNANGILEFDAYPTTLPASDVYAWAKAATKPTYSWGEITDKAITLSGYGITDAYTKTEVNTKLTDGSVTKIGTKDVGSATLPIYLKAGVPTACNTTLGVSITGNSATATKLANARTLWGQSFDGSANVSGDMTGVGTITPTGEDLKVVGNLIVTGGIVMYADDGATIESGFAALLAAHIDGVTIKYNEAQGKIYSVMTGIKVNGATYKPSETDGYITIPDYPTSLDWENIENKPSTFTPASHTHTFASLTSKPTTLSGYGITDAKIANGVITLGTATITPLTAHQTVTLASGTNNGTLKLTVGSKTTDNIAVKGLGSAAYTDSSAYAAASHTHSQYLVASSLDGYVNALTDNTSTNVFVTAIAKSGKTLSYTKSFTKKSLTAASHSGWSSADTDKLIIPDMSFIAYWNGAYNSNGNSNLAYCNKGAFGDMATAVKSSYYTKSEVGTKLTDGSVTKLGTATVGSGTQHFYLNGGTATASTSNVGGTAKPMYLNAGVMTAISDTVGGTAKPIFLNAGTLTAISATVGSASKPVYLSGGSITACSYDFNSYLPLAGGTMTAGARISHADGNLYLGRSDNNGWLMCQDMCSHSGSTYWKLMADGTFHSKVAVVSGNTSVGSLTINGINVTKSSDGILKIDGNLIVTGGITMYATDGVASGLMEQILVDGTTIGKKADGTLYAINTGNVRSIVMGSTTYTPNDSGAVTLPEKVTWANIEGKPSTFTPSVHTHNDYVTALGTNGNYLTWTKNGSTSNITVPFATTATSAGRTKFLETFIQGSTTDTYGSSYPIWAQWSNDSNVRLKCTNYTVWTDKADYATSAGNADTLDGNHASAFATASHTHSYLPLSGGSLSGSLRIDCPTSQANNYNEGVRCNLGGANSWASVVLGGASGSTSGAGSGVYSLLVNSSLFRIRQNNTDVIYVNTSNNVGIGVSPSYKLHVAGDIYTTTGFKKSGSSDSYVLLGGGGHKAVSDFATSGHTHSYLYTEQVTQEQNSDAYTWIREYVMSHKRGHVYNTHSLEWQYLYGISSAGTYGNIIRSTYGDGVPAMQIMGLYNGNWSSWVNVLTEKNYNSYAPTLTGTGASGTWGISISGNATTSTKSSYTRGILGRYTNGNDCGATDDNIIIAEWNTNSDNRWYLTAKGYECGVGYAKTATKLTSSAGSATLPIYFRDGKPVACTASSVFSNLSNSGNNISVTVAGQNRTLTVGYASNADTLDGVQGDHYFKRQGRLGAYNIDTLTEFASRDIQPSHEETISGTKPFNNWGTLLTFKSLTDNGGIQIAGGDNRMYFRSAYNSSFGNNWNTIAYLTDNVATASKWAAARKITLTGSVTGSVSIDGSGDVTLATTTNHTHSYLPLSGGTMTGVLTAKANMYEDAYNGALNMANSDIYGLNSIYTADLSDGQAEGIHFYRTSTTVDTFRISNGVMYFAPNRTLGSTATEYTVIHSGNYNSYAPSKTGTGASGTWGINITGNAATASKWATARTLTLTGSVTGSVSIDGSGNVSLATTTNHTHAYLPLAGGTMNASARISHADGNMYLGRADNNGWVMCQDMCSQTASGDTYWSLRADGTFHAKNTTLSGTCDIRNPNAGATSGLVAHKIMCYPSSYYGLVTRIYSTGCVSLQAQRESSNSEVFPLSLNPLGGNVGIGTTETSYKLHVNGRIFTNTGLYVSSDTWSDITIFRGSFGSAVIGVSGGGSGAVFGHTLNGTTKYISVLSGTGLTVDENIIAKGGITMYSDLRKKNILSNEVLSVKEIAAAPLFRHTYKSDENHYLHIGTSAQYWSAIHEDWFTRKDSEGYYQMELQNLGVAMGISLAREIVTFEGAFKKYESKTDKKIRLMKKRINELEKANESLEARVKELEERRTA